MGVAARKTTSLYLCYQSLLDPLTQSQVVAYLEGLARDGYGIVLLTFEPARLGSEQAREWQEYLAARGITWYWTRYHKRPSLPATLWDILCGVLLGFWLVQKHGVTLVHARSHVPGVMALLLKRLTGTRLLFDIRGFKAEEQVDAGLWRPNSLVFVAMKAAERAVTGASDGIVVLTARAEEMLRGWYPDETAGKPIQVIPCCVDVSTFPPPPPTAGAARNGLTLVYVGKLGGWYMIDEMLAFFETALERIPDLRMQIWTQSDASSLLQETVRRGWSGKVRVGIVPAKALPQALQGADAGFSLIRPTFSKRASSPTKVGEYLAAGLPVITTAGVGDLDAVLSGNGSGKEAAGIILHDLSAEGRQKGVECLLGLLGDPETRVHCRQAAEKHFDLHRVGWPLYRELYGRLLPARRTPVLGNTPDLRALMGRED